MSADAIFSRICPRAAEPDISREFARAREAGWRGALRCCDDGRKHFIGGVESSVRSSRLLYSLISPPGAGAAGGAMAERPLSSFFDDWDEEDESETFEDATAGPDGGGAAGGDAGDGDAEATSIEATTRAVASATIDDDDDDDDADDGEEDDEWGDAEWNGADDDEDVAGDASGDGDGDDRDATNRHEIPFADFSVRTPTERATMHMKRALRRWTSCDDEELAVLSSPCERPKHASAAWRALRAEIRRGTRNAPAAPYRMTLYYPPDRPPNRRGGEEEEEEEEEEVPVPTTLPMRRSSATRTRRRRDARGAGSNDGSAFARRSSSSSRREARSGTSTTTRRERTTASTRDARSRAR